MGDTGQGGATRGEGGGGGGHRERSNSINASTQVCKDCFRINKIAFILFLAILKGKNRKTTENICNFTLLKFNKICILLF